MSSEEQEHDEFFDGPKKARRVYRCEVQICDLHDAYVEDRMTLCEAAGELALRLEETPFVHGLKDIISDLETNPLHTMRDYDEILTRLNNFADDGDKIRLIY